MTFIVFVDPLRKKLVWALSDFVKIQKIFEPLKRLLGTALSYFHPPPCTTLHIFALCGFAAPGSLRMPAAAYPPYAKM